MLMLVLMLMLMLRPRMMVVQMRGELSTTMLGRLGRGTWPRDLAEEGVKQGLVGLRMALMPAQGQGGKEGALAHTRLVWWPLQLLQASGFRTQTRPLALGAHAGSKVN